MTTKLPTGRPPDPETQAEAQALAERFVAKRVRKYLEVLDGIALNDEAPPDQRRMAIAALFERGLGKAAIPEKDDQLGRLQGILTTIAKIGNQQQNARIIEVSPGRADAGSEVSADRGRSLPTPQSESPLDHPAPEGDS